MGIKHVLMVAGIAGVVLNIGLAIMVFRLSRKTTNTDEQRRMIALMDRISRASSLLIFIVYGIYIALTRI